MAKYTYLSKNRECRDKPGMTKRVGYRQKRFRPVHLEVSPFVRPLLVLGNDAHIERRGASVLDLRFKYKIGVTNMLITGEVLTTIHAFLWRLKPFS